ncbi:MAG: hypothetical protein CMM87_01285 [Rickettsiales bacterium]|nr:hypothetical protein [Rickettsiales bacterium]|tara:strand:- start:70154 stop:71038 length:885 start_codon:yes stop_codon:yes gene_type:complete
MKKIFTFFTLLIACTLSKSVLQSVEDLPPGYKELVKPPKYGFIDLNALHKSFSKSQKAVLRTWAPQRLKKKGLTLLKGADILENPKEYFANFWQRPYTSASLIGGNVLNPLFNYGLIFEADPSLILFISKSDSTIMSPGHLASSGREMASYFKDMISYNPFQAPEAILRMTHHRLRHKRPMAFNEDAILIGAEQLQEKTIYLGHNEIVLATQDPSNPAIRLKITGIWYRDIASGESGHMCYQNKLSPEKIAQLKTIAEELKLPLVPLTKLAGPNFDPKKHLAGCEVKKEDFRPF